MKKIALIIGHSEKNQGAVSYNGLTEFKFNSAVAHSVSFRFCNQRVRSFYSDQKDKIKRFDPSLIVELHFNAFERPAYGCEALVIQGSENAKYEAVRFLKAFSKHYGIRSRGVKELSHKMQRGFRNFNGLKDRTVFLFEPCFATFKTRDSQKIIEKRTEYIEFLVDYFNFYFENRKNFRPNILEKMIGIIRSWIKG